jgi:hypothetical protein
LLLVVRLRLRASVFSALRPHAIGTRRPRVARARRARRARSVSAACCACCTCCVAVLPLACVPGYCCAPQYRCGCTAADVPGHTLRERADAWDRPARMHTHTPLPLPSPSEPPLPPTPL